jgi:membrane fusion protein (multidrug efflux system)
MSQAGSVGIETSGRTALEAHPEDRRPRRDGDTQTINRPDQNRSRDDQRDGDVTDQDRSSNGGNGKKRSRWLRPVLMVGGVVILLVLVLLYWLFTGGSVDITDTYVRAARVNLSTDVSGLVKKVEVHDHQTVQPGQVLFRLDPSNFRIAIASAQANLDAVKQQISGSRQSYAASIAQVKAQMVLIHNDQINFDRYASLVKSGGVTRAAYDNAKYKLAGDQAKLAALKAQSGVSLAKLNENPKIHYSKLPSYKAAVAELDRAKLNYRHSVVRAPFAGVVTETEKLQPGMFLAAGTAAFGLVSTTDVWIRSQPKESELTWVKPGDKTKIHVDTYPGKTWNGVVASISPASGSSFSILPAQNSSGNWVKVVQRIPLRVNITSGPSGFVLRNGMSAEVTIVTGHKRKLSNLF